MDTLPIELVTIIAVDTFELFTTLLRVNTIGQRLCAEYPQLIAKGKFMMTITDTDSNIFTYLNKKLHSFGDQPAVINVTNYTVRYNNFHNNTHRVFAIYTKEIRQKYNAWYRYGKLHRDNDLPAIIHTNGSKEWYQNGLSHRNNLPAVEYASGEKEWYKHDYLHSFNDQPAIIHANGDKRWYKHGQLHRNGDQPAMICNGSRLWYQHDNLHRIGLPAVIYADGTVEYWQNGQLV